MNPEAIKVVISARLYWLKSLSSLQGLQVYGSPAPPLLSPLGLQQPVWIGPPGPFTVGVLGLQLFVSIL